MKVWVVGRNYPSPNNNRQGSFELEQAKMIGKRGNDVTYIACVLHPFWRINGGGFVSFEDAPVRVCAYSGFFTPHMTNPLIQAPYFPKLRNEKWEKLLEKAEKETGLPNVIHIHFPLMVMASEVFKKYHERGVKIVVTEHWTKVLNNRLDNYEKRQMVNYLRFVDTYSSVGYTLKKAIIEIAGTTREIEVIPNIINDLFVPEEKDTEIFTFGLVGRLVPEKQMDEVIRAFSDLYKGDRYKHLVIIGNGKEYKKLNNLAELLGIKAQVEFKGSLSREDTAKEVGKFNCFVCYSSYETFGVPVIEAWACGIPVITTTADCIVNQWDQGLGISIGHTNRAELKDAMRSVERNINFYDSAYIRKYAVDRYSEDNIFEKLMSIYKV